MFVIPVFMIVLAVIYAITNYFLARPKLLNEDIMSDADYVGGALVEVFLITLIEALSIFLGMGIYNNIAAASAGKLAEVPVWEIGAVLTIVVLGAATPAYLFIQQLRKLKTAPQNP